MMSGTSSLPLCGSLYFNIQIHTHPFIITQIILENLYVILLHGWKQLRHGEIEIFLKLRLVVLETTFNKIQEVSHPIRVALSASWNFCQPQFPLWLKWGKWLNSTMSLRHIFAQLCFPRATCDISEGFVWARSLSAAKHSVLPVDYTDSDDKPEKRGKVAFSPQTCFTYLKHTLYWKVNHVKKIKVFFSSRLISSCYCWRLAFYGHLVNK